MRWLWRRADPGPACAGVIAESRTRPHSASSCAPQLALERPWCRARTGTACAASRALCETTSGQPLWRGDRRGRGWRSLLCSFSCGRILWPVRPAGRRRSRPASLRRRLPQALFPLPRRLTRTALPRRTTRRRPRVTSRMAAPPHPCLRTWTTRASLPPHFSRRPTPMPRAVKGSLRTAAPACLSTAPASLF